MVIHNHAVNRDMFLGWRVAKVYSRPGTVRSRKGCYVLAEDIPCGILAWGVIPVGHVQLNAFVDTWEALASTLGMPVKMNPEITQLLRRVEWFGRPKPKMRLVVAVIVPTEAK